ncbi:hypothetical protein M9458_048978, partial [Cirrhinus mrigala]
LAQQRKPPSDGTIYTVVVISNTLSTRKIVAQKNAHGLTLIIPHTMKEFSHHSVEVFGPQDQAVAMEGAGWGGTVMNWPDSENTQS